MSQLTNAEYLVAFYEIGRDEGLEHSAALELATQAFDKMWTEPNIVGTLAYLSFRKHENKKASETRVKRFMKKYEKLVDGED